MLYIFLGIGLAIGMLLIFIVISCLRKKGEKILKKKSTLEFATMEVNDLAKFAGRRWTGKLSEFDRRRINKLASNSNSLDLQGPRAYNLSNKSISIDKDLRRARELTRFTDFIRFHPNIYKFKRFSPKSIKHMTSEQFVNQIKKKSDHVSSFNNTKLNNCKILFNTRMIV